MTKPSLRLIRTVTGLAMAAALAAGAGSVFAQVEPGHGPAEVPPLAPAPKPHATSSIEATAATPAEQRETRTLAAAVFARPAAAAKAAEKATEATQPDLAAQVQPKDDWTPTKPPLVGGRGLELKAPF
jgi:hypothetical protein